MSAAAAAARRETEALRTVLATMRAQLGYLARNMDVAFDGALEPEHATSYACVVSLLGACQELEHVIRRTSTTASRAASRSPSRRASSRSTSGG